MIEKTVFMQFNRCMAFLRKFIFSIFFLISTLSWRQLAAETEACLRKRNSVSEKQQKKLSDLFFPSTHVNGEGTNVLLVEDGDCVLYRRAKASFDADSKHILWSVTKSILSIAFGRAEYLGKISRDDLLSKYYPNFNHPYKESLSLKHLLMMSSGIYWNESYEKNPLESNVIKMLYGSGASNMPEYVMSQGVQYPPGSHWRYSSGESNLLMGALQKAFVMRAEDFSLFLDQQVFRILGIEDYTWEKDSSGNFIASSSLYLSALDLLKFGKLMLQNGSWEGRRVLPQDWSQFSTSFPPAFSEKDAKSEKSTAYGGAHWWINKAFGGYKIWPEASERSFAALGHWGQILGVVPDKDIVFVRFANDRKDQLSLSEAFSVMESF